ncbi:hypothetical protein GCM10011512_09060 [Tersicoccus solisilvae]|uniref:Uncharacterized protein n=1 Tax=Tersicoccus solisilvae TaxID=1882339 RepID=A0ABQ1NWK8_9MICC|nr:hypothetical protein [Tersicoccus solisilvae]GGC84412.1 hypothetical protein GCM10011512_09060 [Tersicoccus solisilvae]
MSAAADLETLRRWDDAGGHWRVVGRSATGVTVALCRCDGGEELQRFTSDDADLLAWLGNRDDATG